MAERNGASDRGKQKGKKEEERREGNRNSWISGFEGGSNGNGRMPNSWLDPLSVRATAGKMAIVVGVAARFVIPARINFALRESGPCVYGVCALSATLR